ncbi:Bis(5'-nucleosyl)-tetraphosphatase PrpE [asymmetrical] [Symmachiella macrocystis]|uniref:Bis(5'-nucleosyl)-tetraphosphatase PrpE [asymmetrical] n=1 Tax=Symmachiella macrocystis TaxID=2527985 RepID=A0A5C6BDG2_9PLAN|nr:metallophosphoesterase [Symmachiella macrocystis]TWU09319.1 Bis(5'-nucleosyl)-tetraphosphatase PrpE [asymmetrical] [Symmachiella macrocystis]
MYDIIGDIHGYADELIKLLEELGYNRQRGYYAHPQRTAVFVGDFIDRGPQIREVLQIVRPMVESGSARAVMGNHEFNAIAWSTPHPADPHRYLREHSDKNNGQFAATCKQLTDDERAEAIDWFRKLPMWLSLEGINVVHACWQPSHHATITAALKHYGGVTTDFMVDATNKGSDLYLAVDDVLKGKEFPLPEGITYRDKDGNLRTNVRVRWFESPEGKSLRDYALPPAPLAPDTPLTTAMVDTRAVYAADSPPVFLGHYWLWADRPSRLATNVACVDYSVAKNGILCAYRWHGEQELADENFVCVASRS